jgi:phospholipase C
VIIQENRTLDNLFMGYPGADTQNWGYDSKGKVIPLVSVPLFQKYDLDHSPGAVMRECHWNGTQCSMAGFDEEYGPGDKLNRLYPYQYTQESDVAEYWSLAQAGGLADRMFQTNEGPSFPAHQDLIAGQSGYDTNPAGMPWGCDGKTPYCFDYQTIGDLADAAGVSWQYCSPGGNNVANLNIWQAFDAIRHIRYGPDWTNGDVCNVYRSFFGELTDGKLPAITYIVPDGVNSDHPGSGQFGTRNYDHGPQWVAQVENAIAASPYASNTAVLLTWDDWGGWYDHVAPPAPNGVMTLGFRVPLVVDSPWTPPGYVSHQQHDFGSILHFIETTFGLGSLGTADAQSDDLSDFFVFGQRAHKLARIHARPLPPEDPREVNDPADDDGASE